MAFTFSSSTTTRSSSISTGYDCSRSAPFSLPTSSDLKDLGRTPASSDSQEDQPLLFSVLPLDLLHSVLSLIPVAERRVLLSVSHRFTSIVTHPSFLLTRKSNGTADEILFLIGGTCPTRTRRGLGERVFGTRNFGSVVNLSSSHASDHRHRSRSLMGHADTFSRGLWGYVPSLKSWRIFGGDPRRVPDHPMQTVVDSKAVFLPHPHFQVVLLGGYNSLIGEEVDRVISYSLLTGKWSAHPSMLRARKGSDLHVQFVPPNHVVVIGCSHGRCGCSRCAGGSVNHDALDVDCWVNAPRNVPLRNKIRQSAHGGICSNTMYGQTTFLDEGKMKGSAGIVGAVFDGHAEVFDLTCNTWTRRPSRAPSCPPRDGGAVLLESRYIFMPGVERSTSSKRPTWRSNDAKRASDASSTSGSDSEDTSSDGSDIGSPIAQSPPSSRCSSPALPCPGLDSSRPGLIYDVLEDTWTFLRCNRSSSTRFPTTLAYKGNVLVMGGYRSGRSGDSIMSLFRDGLISDYDEHALNCWTYSRKEGLWRRGSDCLNTFKRKGEEGINSKLQSAQTQGLPKSIPVALRGASALLYHGRLTLLGGMTTFNESGDDEERRVIWQYHGEDEELSSCTGLSDSGNGPNDDEDTSTASSVTVEDELSEFSTDAASSSSINGWRPLFLDWQYGKSTQVKLPVSSLLDTYAFSAHI